MTTEGSTLAWEHDEDDNPHAQDLSPVGRRRDTNIGGETPGIKARFVRMGAAVLDMIDRTSEIQGRGFEK